ncbi:MAG: ATP-binding protein [Gammaproteobacteria bacterium]|nr:ATP-binding protein [Gammaproteobacteria bacterium]
MSSSSDSTPLKNGSPSVPRFRHRLSIRLIGVFLVTAFVLVIIISGLFRGVWRSHLQDAVRPHLDQYLVYIQQDIGSPPDVNAAKALTERLPIDIAIIGPSGQWSSLADGLKTERLEIYRRHRQRDDLVEYGEYQDRFFLRLTDGSSRIYIITDPLAETHRDLMALGLLICLVLAALFAGYWCIRWLVKPVETLENGVRRIGSGELQHRIEVDRRDELGTLATSVNTMATQIEAMLEAKRQLFLAISHELRTPLTRANVSLALLEDAVDTKDVQNDLAEIEQLTSELLNAERLDGSHAVLQLENVTLDELIREVVAESFEQENVKVTLPDRASAIAVDPVRAKVLLRNLLSNAIRHNHDARGPVEIVYVESDTDVQFRVIDHGEGIPPADLPRVTEPFWRRDSSRQRDTGGFGLGLYLARRIAEAHGGELRIESAINQGTVATVRLPRHRVPSPKMVG